MNVFELLATVARRLGEETVLLGLIPLGNHRISLVIPRPMRLVYEQPLIPRSTMCIVEYIPHRSCQMHSHPKFGLTRTSGRSKRIDRQIREAYPPADGALASDTGTQRTR